ncbi:hypothetical protein GCM10009840_00130 [Pseudolysinimonas kribbensis]|uniref:LytR C-terminal domain-containing protein n=1 Tax=Pseudolysinimonas kribbensis TaxID=433641 RepID=UPI0031D57CEB
MASFPRDQFDDVPDGDGRVGAHRAPARRGRGWIAFAWAALATGVLVIVGLFVLSRIDPSFELPSLPLVGGNGGSPSASASATPTEAPVAEPSDVPSDVAAALTISVLNGTPDAQLDDKAGAAIKAAGWPVPTLADASSESIKTTVVYYSDAQYEGISRGVAKALGTSQVQLSDAFPGAKVTVVLGSDYKG